jgi:hypothetical protein
VAQIALDNDIVAKCATYTLLCHIAAVSGISLSELGVLGTILFVIKIRHLETASVGASAAYARLRKFVGTAELLEPTDEESRVAARLEEAALKIGVQLDVGESQLCAIVITRKMRMLCTGDKRAIQAIERLVDAMTEVAYLKERILPFEGLIKRMLARLGYLRLRKKICSSRGTDKALEICFQCHQEDGKEAEALAGLDSYLGAIAKDAPQVLTQ